MIGAVASSALENHTPLLLGDEWPVIIGVVDFFHVSQRAATGDVISKECFQLKHFGLVFQQREARSIGIASLKVVVSTACHMSITKPLDCVHKPSTAMCPSIFQ
mmetsp:Transcript_30702/g.64263  ORF Transcript_30702/g.64263 Transcript_30702/m.64263 type:complete len:104 (-) Transcript_30702:122-433(-)